MRQLSENKCRQGQETPAYILGFLTASGGLYGYVKTGSIPSVTAGVLIGLLYLSAGYQIQTRQPYAVPQALLASVILAGASIPRAIKTHKSTPIGLSALALYGLYTFSSSYRSAR
ncbi:TMEM14 protein-like protein [Erysiphe neolycopersici]|uniref:TMEM14 protein-like protein n=1 Tax=Erysiphe neolycopersici TaxID=212602 RepID=A0A420HSW2_9PEZI|nr:TMEM14 protein-like protein [Erysiphe neolycopersici]